MSASTTVCQLRSLTTSRDIQKDYSLKATTKISDAANLVKDAVNSVALPQFAMKVRTTGKDTCLAEVQAQYDGVTMIYGRDKAGAGVYQAARFTSNGSSDDDHC